MKYFAQLIVAMMLVMGILFVSDAQTASPAATRAYVDAQYQTIADSALASVNLRLTNIIYQAVTNYGNSFIPEPTFVTNYVTTVETNTIHEVTSFETNYYNNQYIYSTQVISNNYETTVTQYTSQVTYETNLTFDIVNVIETNYVSNVTNIGTYIDTLVTTNMYVTNIITDIDTLIHTNVTVNIETNIIATYSQTNYVTEVQQFIVDIANETNFYFAVEGGLLKLYYNGVAIWQEKQ